jgi:O-methyltransferase
MVPYARLVTLYQQVIFCETWNIPGCFVECGTWKGGAVGLMALGNLEAGATRRHLHLFDSFEGIPEPDVSIDGEKAVQQVVSIGGRAKGRLMPVAGFYEKYAGGVGTLEENRSLLEEVIGYDPSFLHYHKGWFQNTLPEAAPDLGSVAILRLDADWYASTKICLEHLYDNVVSGGFVIIDDYGCYEGCKKAVDEFMKRRGVRAYLNHIDSEGRYLIKP